MPRGGRNLAAMGSSSDNPGGRESKVASISGILFGIFLVATFASTYNFPAGPAQADATLAQFSSLRTAFFAGNAFIGLAAVFGVYGFVTMRGKPFPRWLGYVGILAAIVSLVAAAPVSGAFSALIAGVVLILVWVFGTSGLIWRSQGP